MSVAPPVIDVEGEAIVLGGNSWMSGSSSGYPNTAVMAVDGNNNGIGTGSCAITTTADLWWAVDLGSTYDVTSVVVWNREDCCGEFIFPVNMPLVSSTGPVLGRCCQHWPSTGSVLAHTGMFTGIVDCCSTVLTSWKQE